jgi:hypothetical protein
LLTHIPAKIRNYLLLYDLPPFSVNPGFLVFPVFLVPPHSSHFSPSRGSTGGGRLGPAADIVAREEIRRHHRGGENV